MPVVATVRHILRGKIRGQVTYAQKLGRRLVTAYEKNPELQIFAGTSGPASVEEFVLCLDQFQRALTTRA
jgi:hypothetical protein